MAQHRWGVSKSEKACAAIQAKPTKPVGMLTLRQRGALAGLLGRLVTTSRRRTRVQSDAQPVAPERSLQQRLDALRGANEVRTARKLLKLDLKTGQRSLDTLIARPPAAVMTMHVFDLLLAAPKWGRAKTQHALSDARVSPSKTVGGLSDRQRTDLLRVIREREAQLARNAARPAAPRQLRRVDGGYQTLDDGVRVAA